MKTILAACLALGMGSLASIAPAHAQVRVQGPGVSLNVGPQPYWREHRDDEWRDRREFREAQHRRMDWQREHCVRDWSGPDCPIKAAGVGRQEGRGGGVTAVHPSSHTVPRMTEV